MSEHVDGTTILPWNQAVFSEYDLFNAQRSAQPTACWHARRIPVCSSQPSDCDIRLLRGGGDYVPPFCPHRHCSYHQRSVQAEGRWYEKWGFCHNRSFGRIQRFRCHGCGASFSEMSFSLDVHIKRRADYRHIERALSEGSGVRAIARRLEVSTGTVINRLERAARSAFATLAELSVHLSHRESLAFDGFRSFCVSQHLPCDITHLIGRESEYVYLFDYAPLRRGGRKSAAQRASQQRFERLMSPSAEATEQSARRIYDHILETGRWPPEHPPKEIWSDEHYAYCRAWHAHSHITHAQHLGWVTHRTISAKAPRTAQNPIRAVNYFDRELRKDMAEHQRETVCFARTPHGMLARFAVYVAHHNMDKPKRIRGSRSPSAAERTATSHAVAAGAPPAVVARLQLTRLTSRPFLSRTVLGEFASVWWRGEIPTPPQRRMPHVQAYVFA